MQGAVMVLKSFVTCKHFLLWSFIQIFLSHYTFHVPFYFTQHHTGRILYHEGSDPLFHPYMVNRVPLNCTTVLVRVRSPRDHLGSICTAFCTHYIKYLFLLTVKMTYTKYTNLVFFPLLLLKSMMNCKIKMSLYFQSSGTTDVSLGEALSSLGIKHCSSRFEKSEIDRKYYKVYHENYPFTPCGSIRIVGEIAPHIGYWFGAFSALNYSTIVLGILSDSTPFPLSLRSASFV